MLSPTQAALVTLLVLAHPVYLYPTALRLPRETLPDSISPEADPNFDPRAASPLFTSQVASPFPAGTPGIFICPLPNWGGSCFWSGAMPLSRYGDCGIVTAMNGWNSIGPDKGIVVDLYDNAGCDGTMLRSLVWPGDANLGAEGYNTMGVKYIGMKVFGWAGGNDPNSAPAPPDPPPTV